MDMRIISRPLALGAAIFTLLLAVGPSPAAIVDPEAAPFPERPLLESLSSALEGAGVDVRLGRPTQRTDQSLASRPQLGRLVTLPAPPEGQDLNMVGFSAAFVHSVELSEIGVDTVLLAVGGTGQRTASNIRDFDQLWAAATPENRIFVSFAKADADRAKIVAAALMDQGYVPFIYIRDDGQPWSNAVDVGRYFQQAQVKLVIDTPAARTSPGILIEREAALALADGSIKARMANKNAAWDDRAIEFIVAEEASGSGPCCKWCRKPGSLADRCRDALIGRQCGKTVCGKVCLNARSS